MKNNQRKKVIFGLLCAVVIIEAIVIVGFCITDMEASDPSIQETTSKRTNTDAKEYMVTVAGKVRGDNAEEAKEHFWEDICSEVAGEWCISEIDL